MQPTDQDLRAYLDEALPAETMAQFEQQFRGDQQLVRRLAALVSERDSGFHALGEIWRRHRLTCPSRSQLGSYLLHVLPADEANYIGFHLTVVGCRGCQANLTDLQSQQAEPLDGSAARRKRYFQSSAGFLGGKK